MGGRGASSGAGRLKNGGSIKSNTFNQTIQIGFGENSRTYKTNEITKEFSEDSKKQAGMLAMADKKSEILGDVRQFYSKYQDGQANKENYFVNTIAEFENEKGRPKRKPDYVSYTRDGKVSSEYWYGNDGVIRGSKHWGTGVASCDWYIKGQGTDMHGRKQYAKAKWSDFTQKTQIATNEETGEALMSTFKNTIGGRKQGLGLSTPIVKGIND